MPTPDQAFNAYIAMWNAPDEARCRALAGQALTEDVVIQYPTFQAYGPAEAVTVATRFHQDNPGVHIVRNSGIEHHHSWIRGTWRMLAADGSAMRDGQTIIELAEDGRLRRAIGFLDPLPERS